MILIHFMCSYTHGDEVHRWFQDPGELYERETHVSWLDYCLVAIYSHIVLQATLAMNVRPLHSKSAHSQVFTAVFYVRTVRSCGHVSVQTICRLLTFKQRVGDGYLSQNIGLGVAGSARPAPLLKVNTPDFMEM